jgi:hypothetical protein
MLIRMTSEDKNVKLLIGSRAIIKCKLIQRVPGNLNFLR